MTILNLTQHAATADQLTANVVDLQGDALTALKAAITFPAVYTAAMLRERAQQVANIAKEHGTSQEVMIGGMPSFMPVLESVLIANGFAPAYACSERVSVDGGDGQKVSVFKHAGFYWAE